MSKKRRRYNQQPTQAPTPTAPEPQPAMHHVARTHQRTPLLFALATALLFALIAWMVLQSMDQTDTPASNQSETTPIEVEQADGGEGPAETLGDTLQGSADQSSSGTDADSLQLPGSSDAFSQPGSTELFNKVENGDLEISQ